LESFVSKNKRVFRPSSRAIALEPRLLFDGAGAVAVVDAQPDRPAEPAPAPAPAPVAEAPAPGAAADEHPAAGSSDSANDRDAAGVPASPAVAQGASDDEGADGAAVDGGMSTAD